MARTAACCREGSFHTVDFVAPAHLGECPKAPGSKAFCSSDCLAAARSRRGSRRGHRQRCWDRHLHPHPVVRTSEASFPSHSPQAELIDHSRRTDTHVNYSNNTKQHELLNIPSSPCETLGRVKCAEIVDSRGACLATTHLAARVTGPSSTLSGKGGLDATRVRRGDLSELLPQHLPAQCPS